MGVPTDISVLYTRHPEILKRAFSLVPEYLRTAEDPRALNLMDYGVPLGRRFRALKLWFVMRYYGREGLAARIRDHVAWARELAATIAADDRFELCAPVPLSLVCFRRKGSDDANRELLDRVERVGRSFSVAHRAQRADRPEVGDRESLPLPGGMCNGPGKLCGPLYRSRKWNSKQLLGRRRFHRGSVHSRATHTAGHTPAKEVRNPDGTGSVHPADIAAGDDADLGATIQPTQLWVQGRGEQQ